MMHRIVQFSDRYRILHGTSPSTKILANELGVDKSTVYRYLVQMDRDGMIRYDGHEIITSMSGKHQTELTGAAVLGVVSCGLPQLEEEYIESYVALPTSLFGNGQFFILRANGDSMTEAGIDDGDLVIVRQTERAEEGQIIVALIDDGTTTLKRFYIDRYSGMVRLHPENSAMEDILVKNCQVQGVAVNVIKKL